MMTTKRTRLPDTRRSVTCKRSICGFEVYITIGFYDDGTDKTDLTSAIPGEIFIKIAKHGTELSGMTDCLAILFSMALQYGVPWEKMRDKFIGYRFGQDDLCYTSLIDGIVHCVDEQIIARASRLAEPEEEEPTTVMDGLLHSRHCDLVYDKVTGASVIRPCSCGAGDAAIA